MFYFSKVLCLQAASIQFFKTKFRSIMYCYPQKPSLVDTVILWNIQHQPQSRAVLLRLLWHSKESKRRRAMSIFWFFACVTCFWLRGYCTVITKMLNNLIVFQRRPVNIGLKQSYACAIQRGQKKKKETEQWIKS